MRLILGLRVSCYVISGVGPIGCLNGMILLQMTQIDFFECLPINVEIFEMLTGFQLYGAA